jgi:hypothetical protein
MTSGGGRPQGLRTDARRPMTSGEVSGASRTAGGCMVPQASPGCPGTSGILADAGSFQASGAVPVLKSVRADGHRLRHPGRVPRAAGFQAAAVGPGFMQSGGAGPQRLVRMRAAAWGSRFPEGFPASRGRRMQVAFIHPEGFRGQKSYLRMWFSFSIRWEFRGLKGSSGMLAASGGRPGPHGFREDAGFPGHPVGSGASRAPAG